MGYIDNDKTNNHVSNLQWISSKDNKRKIPFERRSVCRQGEKNGRATFTDNEVLEIRKFYVTHTLEETYNMYGDRSANKESFRGLIANSYKHLPIYSKRNKQWSLNGEVIQINNFNPVSTIPVSRE